MDQEKLMNVLKDKTFVEKLVKLQTPEEVQVAFKEKGIEISIEEIGLLGSIINKMVEKGTTELSKEDLEDVSGGAWKENMKNFGTGMATPLTIPFMSKHKAAGAGMFVTTAALVVGAQKVVPWGYKKVKGVINSYRGK